MEGVSSSGTACSHSCWSFLTQLVLCKHCRPLHVPWIPDCSSAGCRGGEQGFLSVHGNSLPAALASPCSCARPRRSSGGPAALTPPTLGELAVCWQSSLCPVQRTDSTAVLKQERC